MVPLVPESAAKGRSRTLPDHPGVEAVVPPGIRRCNSSHGDERSKKHPFPKETRYVEAIALRDLNPPRLCSFLCIRHVIPFAVTTRFGETPCSIH